MSLNTIPGTQVAFTDLVDHLLTEEDSTFNTFPLRPSYAGKCSRALAYELFEYLGKGSFPKEQKDPNTKRLLSLGTPIEYHVIRQFDLITKANPDFKITYKQQVVIAFQLEPANAEDTNPPLIKGSIDFAVEQLKERWTILCDSKSAKDKFSQAYQTKWDETLSKLSEMKSVEQFSDTGFWVEDLEAFLIELNDPFFEDNFRQLNVYSCTEFAKKVNVIAGSIIRYNKNDSRWFEVRFKPNEKLAKEFEAKINRIYKAVMNGSETDIEAMGCDFPLGHIKRAFCPCVTYAKEEKDESLKAYFATFPPKKWPTDIKKLGASKSLKGHFTQYLELLKSEEKKSQVEDAIIKLLQEEKCSKVKLDNGYVYEVKHYKTGGIGNGPRVALRRTKA